MQNQTIGFNPVTGMPQTIMVPTTSSAPCTTCGGSGKMYCPSCAGTGRRYVNTGTSTTPTTTKAPTPTPAPSSDSSAAKKTKNGTILEATDGIGNYEDAPNMLDGNTKTKFNVLATSAFVIWKAPKKIRVTSYSITTANDTATYTGRNPKTWVLYGSNKKLSRNDPGWKKIHAVSNDKKLKPVNYKKFTFKLKKAAKAYRYYKLEITANKGADCTQLAEFTLKGK